jgi:hypothetical protein
MLIDSLTITKETDWRSVLPMDLYSFVPVLVANFKTTAIRLITM